MIEAYAPWLYEYERWRARFLVRAGEARNRPELHARMLAAARTPPVSPDGWHERRGLFLELIRELEDPTKTPQAQAAQARQQEEEERTQAAVEAFSELNFPTAPADSELAPPPTIKQLAELSPAKQTACREYAKVLLARGLHADEREAYKLAWRILSPRWQPLEKKPAVKVEQAWPEPWPAASQELIGWLESVTLPAPPIVLSNFRQIVNPELWRKRLLEDLAQGPLSLPGRFALADAAALRDCLAQLEARP